MSGELNPHAVKFQLYRKEICMEGDRSISLTIVFTTTKRLSPCFAVFDTRQLREI